MKLPQIKHPTFALTLPSSKKEVRYRPFLVKEEKILLFAQQSNESKDIINAIKQIITNCIVTEGVDVESFTTYDIEYFFIQLRAKSVNDEVKLAYIDNEDNKQYSFDVNLNDIQVIYPEGHDPKIMITEDASITLKEPVFSVLEAMKATTESELAFEAVSKCISRIESDGQVYEISDFSQEEVMEFVQSLDVMTFQKIQKFFDTMPRLEYVINYKNSLDHDRKIVLSSLNDFFTLG